MFRTKAFVFGKQKQQKMIIIAEPKLGARVNKSILHILYMHMYSLEASTDTSYFSESWCCYDQI